MSRFTLCIAAAAGTRGNSPASVGSNSPRAFPVRPADAQRGTKGIEPTAASVFNFSIGDLYQAINASDIFNIASPELKRPRLLTPEH